MAISFKTSVRIAIWIMMTACTLGVASAQDVQTLEMTTSEVLTINAHLGNTSLIQLPIDPVATNVGDSGGWFVEKNERLVSIKPTSNNSMETNLAVVTRQGVLNFRVRIAKEGETSTQMIRVTRIIEDSKPLQIVTSTQEPSISESIVREIQLSQNYYALQLAQSPELRNVDHITQMKEQDFEKYGVTLLQNFRFRDSRHVVLHFILENKSKEPIAFDRAKTIARVNETLFAPIAVSLGADNIREGGTTENFIVLDGSNGLSPANTFEIFLYEKPK